MRKIVLSLLCVLLLVSTGNAYVSDDMRGVWVASVYNLDYPSSGTTDSWTLKQEAIEILDNVHSMGLNAVFLQVRPSADALYASEIFPWSKYLTGQNGLVPQNGFDPLAFWVEEAHKRGIELHAWINPYRITKNGDSEFAAISESSPAKRYPEYVVRYSDGNYYFNPGIPEVRKLVVEGALEIVRRYDVDGIHMDDYFYPGTSFEDAATYQKYGAGLSIEDWRRNNVDLLIQELNTELHKADKDISFGISPFGIWANSKNNPLGSNTNGTESYSSHYADTRKWALNEWIDYIAPQIYWEVGHKSADYKTLFDWWTNTLKDSKTKLYIGMADYKTVGAGKSSVWYSGKEIKRQLTMNNTAKIVSGEIHYRYSSLISESSLSSLLKEEYKDRDIVIYVNGKKLLSDQKPLLIAGRTMVPLRAIFEALQANVDWEQASQTVTARRGSDLLSLKVGEKEMQVNGTTKKLDVSARLVNGRTLIPLRAVSEALNSVVEWYGAYQTILINL
ncbi:MAG: family 10 glycosylhydrolase [Clostridia bacterium]|nr:family 10 glycosylhydrolase [Clostridia bacterium]